MILLLLKVFGEETRRQEVNCGVHSFGLFSSNHPPWTSQTFCCGMTVLYFFCLCYWETQYSHDCKMLIDEKTPQNKAVIVYILANLGTVEQAEQHSIDIISPYNSSSSWSNITVDLMNQIWYSLFAFSCFWSLQLLDVLLCSSLSPQLCL